MAYPYDQSGMGPGYAEAMYAHQAPGMFGATLGGFTAGDLAGQQQNIQAGAHLFGSGVTGALSAVPALAGTMVGVGAMLAPMAMPGFLDSARLSAGHTGIAATGGVRGALGYGSLKTLEALDPFSHAMRMGGAGWRAGRSAGSAMFRTAIPARLAGGALPAIGRAFANSGVRAGLGMTARFGGAMATGVAGGLAAAALPVAAGLAAFQGLEYSGQQMYQGATDVMHGQALMNEMGPGVAPGQSMRGEGATTGRMMREMSSSLGTEMEDISRYAQQLNSQKVFQTTRNAKEFREKFKEVMKAVKDIAKITQSSVDDAMQMFTDLRQQGFYTTADIKAQAASRQAREQVTGISAGVYSAIGGAGSQMARQYGMRGRVGSDLAQRNVAGVSMGVRSGAMSEEEVMELGGVEAVGMRQAQREMGFLRSSRGRAMIAYAMGEGGAPDQDRLNRLLRGTSMEDIVTGAAGRGLGVLRAAGGREAREQFAPYAGMAMVQMAASQQKQLYGGVSEQGIVGMLGTMGVGRQEAQLMLQQTMLLPQQVRAEQEAKEQAAQRAHAESLSSQYSVTGRAGRLLDRTVGSSLRGFGSDVMSGISDQYAQAMTALVGGEEYVGGDEALARRYRPGSGGTLGIQGAERRTMFGIASASRRVSDQYGELIQGRPGDSEMGSFANLGGGRFVDRRRLAEAQEGYREGMEQGAGGRSTAILRGKLSSGDSLMAEMRRSRREQLGGFTGATMNLGLNWSDQKRTHDEFFLAQQAELVDKNLDYQGFMAMGTRERLKIVGQATAALRESVAKGDQGARELAEHIGQKESGLLATRDLQSMRDQFQAELVGGFTSKFGRSRFTDPFSRRGNQESLAQKLATSGKARAAYDNYIRALSEEEPDPELVQQYEDELREELGGAASPHFRAARDQRTQLEGMSGEERSGFYKETSQLFSQRAYLERVHGNTDRLKARLKGLDVADIHGKDRGLATSVRKLSDSLRSGDLRGRSSAMEDLVLGSVRSGGRIDDLERDTLNRVGGAGQGESIFQTVEGLRKGDSGVLKELYGMEGEGGKSVFAKGELEKIKNLPTAEEQGEAIAKALKKANLTDVFAFGEQGGSGKSVRGVQTQYVEANERFVQSVHAFAAALRGVGIKVPGPTSRDLQDAAESLTSGGNPGEV